jgi:chromosome segregation ATPase
MQKLEDRQAEFQQASGLDEEQSRTIQELLNRLAGSMPPTNSVREQLDWAFEVLTQQQNVLNQHWQTLEQQQSQIQQQQDDVERQADDIQQRWREWHQAQESLEQARAELKAQQSALNTKQEYARMLSVQLQNNNDLHQQIYRLAETSDKIRLGGQPIDLEALEKMPIDELQQKVQELERDLEKLSQFVEIQEEELGAKQEEIDELEAKIQTVSEFDRLSLENDLTDAQDAWQMLNETLVGQRRILQERKSNLNQHRAILRRRQGHGVEEGQEAEVDLSPILVQVETLRQQQAEELQKLENQLEQMQAAIQQAQGMVTTQTVDQENRRNDLKLQEQTLQARRASTAEMTGKVNSYQEILQPVQDGVDGLRQKLEALAGTLAQAQESGDYQLQAIAEIRQMIVSITSTPELAAS